MSRDKKFLSLISVSLFLFIIASCGGGGGGGGESPANPSEINITGTWHGTISPDNASPFSVSFTIVQNGSEITGTYNSSAGGYGNINGSIDGNNINFSVTQANPTCTGTYTGQGTVSGNTITFSGSGTDCTGSYTGNGTVTRT